MWDFLLQPSSDPHVTIAACTAVVAAFTAIVLFVYTLGLRFARIAGDRRRREVVERWRGIIAASIVSAADARGLTLPRYGRRETIDLLEEWNRARESVEGDSAANLIVLGERLGFDVLASDMLQRRRLSTRLLGVQTLGHLRASSEWNHLEQLLDHPNMPLSVTAARALVNIDPAKAMPVVMPRIVARGDWPKTAVAVMLKKAGPSLVTQPLCNAILTSDSDAAVRLLRYSELATMEMTDRLVEQILRERDEPALITAALRAISNHAGLTRIAGLATHPVWHVRMQAAKLLGQVGGERELPLLERMLGDREWWVRYRAAQAIVSLPFLAPNALRAVAQRQVDPFAADIMRQAMAEVGLA